MPLLNGPVNKNRALQLGNDYRRRCDFGMWHGSQLFPTAARGCVSCWWWVLSSHLEEELVPPTSRRISNRGIVAAISVSKPCSFPAGLNIYSKDLMGGENPEGG